MNDKIKTPPPEVIVDRKNPERLPPTLAVAFTASKLNESYAQGARQRNARQTAEDFGLLPKPPSR